MDAARLPCSAADRVLLVGEGDLSFALALARALGTGANLVATTYDAEAELREMYAPWVARTLRDLRGLGAAALHGVDATRLHEPALRGRLDPAGAGFRLVVWNHPHAGFPAEPHGPGFEQGAGWQGRHKRLVGAFLASAAQVLAPGGEVHLAHKAGPPFDGWDLPALAGEAGLQLLGSEPFPQDLFPTYVNRRGAGKKPAKMFPMHDSVRFRFGRGD